MLCWLVILSTGTFRAVTGWIFELEHRDRFCDSNPDRNATQITTCAGRPVLWGINCPPSSTAISHIALRRSLGTDTKRLNSRESLGQSRCLPQAHSQGSRSLLGLWQDSWPWPEGSKGPWKGEAVVSGWSNTSDLQPWSQGIREPVSGAALVSLVDLHSADIFTSSSMAPEMSVINLDRLQQWIDAGRIDATKPITPRELILSGIMGRTYKDGIKLLARGKEALKTPVEIIVSRASAEAIQAVEAAGGKITTRFYTREALRRLVKGESAHTDKPLPVGLEHVESVLEQVRQSKKHLYRLPDPTSRWDIEYYRDPAHRGYLSHMLKEGESPSLYFKVPGEQAARAKSKSKAEEEADPKLF